MTPVVELRAARKRFGPLEALKGVDLAIGPGELVALLGPNGAGKTTSISLMLGLRRPTGGEARLFGLDPTDRRARSRCGVMLQESGTTGVLTVREIVNLFRAYYPASLPAERAIALAGLSDKANARIGTLSGGERQRLYFALAVCGDPDALFLDEPTVGIDVEGRRAVLESIRALSAAGKTIVVMVYGFGIGVANERGMKIDRLMRASPLPPLVFMLAKVVTALVFALLALVLLIGFGIVVGGIHETPVVWATIIARLLAGSLPFIALGFAIGYWSGPHAAPAMANLIYLPLSFASGLFVPLDQLPGFVRALAPFLPSYHYAQLGWSALGAGRESLGASLLWLAGYTALFMTLAVRAYRREARSKFA